MSSLWPVIRPVRLALWLATLAMAVALGVTHVARASQAGFGPGGADLPSLLKEIPASKIQSTSRKAVVQALDLIGRQRLQEGSQQLNAALRLDPANAYLQFFNAYAYHLMGQSGDAQKLDLAEQGYRLAVQFDPANWIARYFLGMLYFEQRNFRGSQHELAEVLLSVGEDPEVLLRLVAAAYYAGDPITAAVCLARLRALQPSDPQILRLSALVSAAINQPDLAARWLEQYQGTGAPSAELARLRGRLDHWKVVHRNSVGRSQTAPPAAGLGPSEPPRRIYSQARTGGSSGGFGTSGGFGGNGGARAKGMAGGGDDDDDDEDEDEDSPGKPSFAAGSGGFGFRGRGGGQQNGPAPVTKFDPNAKRMVLVDLVIMRTEDSLSTRKGVNLLNALTLQFGVPGEPGAPAFSKTFGSEDKSGGIDSVRTATTALTRAISIPALSYSLNIVNSNSNLNEVLARPTLAALEGVQSNFFSGTTLNAAVVSSGTVGGGSVQIEKEIGVKLSILPIFLEGNKIRMTVDAQRTFLKPPSQDVGFTYKLETSKIMVNANVVMEFGETLVLGGLSERETSNSRDGVPLLQDIPGIQYLFSREDADSFHRSVLMLITPRAPSYTYRNDTRLSYAEPGKPGEEGMKELRARYGDWFKPYPNLASVFSQLNSSSLYREFRTGDVTLEKWDRQSTTRDRLRQALEFLFF